MNWRAPSADGLPASPRAPSDVGVGSGRHLPALDGVRGLAVFAVLLFHGGKLDGGYLGVDAFFVLSGFLITGLLLAEVGRSHRVDLGSFWLRRARRLLPALFLVLGGVAVFAWLVASPTELDRIRSDALATLGYVANWHSIAQNHGYWQLFQAPSPLEHTWSLAIEEQFYLVWPLVVFAIAWVVGRTAKRGATGDAGRSSSQVTRFVLIASLALAAASTASMWLRYDPATDPSRLYLGTDTRIGSILLGAALAAFLAWRGPLRGRVARAALELAGVAAVVWLGFAWFTIDGQSAFLYQGGFLLCGVAVAIVIAAAVHSQAGPVGRLLTLKPLCALGIISYGLYLWHWPVYLVLSPTRIGLDGWALIALRITASIALAIASFVLIERPVRRGNFPTRRFVAAIPVAAIVCVAAILVTTSGATPSTTVSALSQGSPRQTRAVKRRLAATQPVTDGRPRLLVMGDSVAGNIATTAADLRDELGVSVGDATSPGCILGRSVTAARTVIHDQTNAFTFSNCDDIWLYGIRAFAPSEVLIVYGSAGAFTDVMIDGQWRDPCSPEYQAMLDRDMTAIVRLAESGGAKVWLARIPHLLADWPPANADARIDCVNNVYAAINARRRTVGTIDLASFICPAGQCQESYQGQRFRTDGMHFIGEPARYVTRWAVAQVNAPAPVPQRVLVAGDSIADVVAPAFESLGPKVNMTVGNGSLGGCALMGRITEYRGSLRSGTNGIVPNVKPCEPAWTAAARAFKPQTVVLINGSNASFTEVNLDGAWVDSCAPSYKSYLESHLEGVLKEFTSAGANVVLTKIPPIDATDWLPDNGNARIACVNDVYAFLTHKMDNVTMVDLAGFICPKGQCRTSIAGQAYRPDGFHPSPPAADDVAAWLAKVVARPAIPASG